MNYFRTGTNLLSGAFQVVGALLMVIGWGKCIWCLTQINSQSPGPLVGCMLGMGLIGCIGMGILWAGTFMRAEFAAMILDKEIELKKKRVELAHAGTTANPG